MATLTWLFRLVMVVFALLVVMMLLGLGVDADVTGAMTLALFMAVFTLVYRWQRRTFERPRQKG